MSSVLRQPAGQAVSGSSLTRSCPQPNQSARPFGQPHQVLVLGEFAAAGQVASVLEAEGVHTLAAVSGGDALAQQPGLAPDVVVLGQGNANDPKHTEVIELLRSRVGERPALVMVGGPPGGAGLGRHRRPVEIVDSASSTRDYLPADVGVAQLVDHVRAQLKRASGEARGPVTEHRLAEETRRELQRAARSLRDGILAVVSVAEVDQLRRRFGSQADEALGVAFTEWAALDADILEQHCLRSEGGVFLLMPETGPAAGRERLRKLSRRIVGKVIEVAGEHVYVTPVIGYAILAGSMSDHALREQAVMALDYACQHLDLLPVQYSPAMAIAANAPVAPHDRLLAVIERLRSPVQIAFTVAVLFCSPFIVYVFVWYAGFDLTRVTYPLVAVALAVTATVLWVECFRAAGPVDVPPEPLIGFPTATAIIAAYLPNEAATIVDTVRNLLAQDYPGELQVILAYNSPRPLPIENVLAQMAIEDGRLLLLRVAVSTSKAQNVNAALTHVRGEFAGVFDADHHPVQGSFERAWRWLSTGHDVVQGHCVVRNGDASWVSRLVAVEFESIYAVSHPGRARLHGFGIFGGSNGYWRTDSLRQIRMHGSMLTEDIDSSMRSLLDGFSIVSDPGLISTELAPTTVQALWNQRMRWAQGWTQTALRHLRPAVTSRRLTGRQRIGAAFLLGWTQLVPWITVQVIPILAFTAWRDGGVHGFNFFIPLFVLLTIYTLSVGIAQTVFAFLLGDADIRRHRGWFILYGLNSTLWFGEFKNVISRVAQIKELVGERQWRVTPRSGTATAATPLTIDAAGMHGRPKAS